jgi:hypothetical protein
VKENDHSLVEILPTSCQESFSFNTKLTVFVDSEPDIHNAHEHFVQQTLSRPNAIWAVSASSPSIQYQFDTVALYWSNLIFTVVNNPEIAPVDIGHKKMLANVLLGGLMPNRTKIFSQLQDTNLLDQCLVNYQPRVDQQHLFLGYRTPLLDSLDSEQWISVATDPMGFFSMRPMSSPEHPGWLSQKISRAVYNHTWLSVVAETENLGQPDTFLPSEKIAKPLLLGQPFVVQACKGFLRQLRNIGFQTFDQWINEDYDMLDSVDQRISAMISSLSEFNKHTDQQKLNMLEQMKPVLAHNRNLIMNLKALTTELGDCICEKVRNQ